MIGANDDHNTFAPRGPHARALHPGCDARQGFEIANLIDNTGQAIVFTGAKEIGGADLEQLKSAGLTMAPLEQC